MGGESFYTGGDLGPRVVFPLTTTLPFIEEGGAIFQSKGLLEKTFGEGHSACVRRYCRPGGLNIHQLRIDSMSKISATVPMASRMT